MLTFLHWLVCVLICAAYILFVNPHVDSPLWQTVAWWIYVALGVLCFAKFVRKWIIPVAALAAAIVAGWQITDPFQQTIAVWGLAAAGTLMLLGAIIPILVDNYKQWASNREYRDYQKVAKLRAKHDVKGLTRMLRKNSAAYVRKAAATALGELRDKRAVNQLIKALTQEGDTQVRAAAVHALGQIGGQRTVESLVNTVMHDKELSVRESAVRALGQIGDRRAVDPLINTVTYDKDYQVRGQAVYALGQLGDKRVIPLLCAVLKEGYVHRGTCVAALDRLGWQPTKDIAGAWYWITKGQYDQCVAIGPPAVEPLIQKLTEKLTGYSPSENVSAARALGHIGDGRAVPPLITALKREEKGVRLAAAEALTRMYQLGALDDGHKRVILAQRATIVEKHVDGQHGAHFDTTPAHASDCTPYHDDYHEHVDKGIGVPFPD